MGGLWRTRRGVSSQNGEARDRASGRVEWHAAHLLPLLLREAQRNPSMHFVDHWRPANSAEFETNASRAIKSCVTRNIYATRRHRRGNALYER